MKKLISILLVLAMGASLFVIGAAAATPEGTAITDAAGFAAMADGGKYYLANDLTLTETYAATFNGTLDGNGKTVTISAPIFSVLGDATIKNLSIAGAVEGTDDDIAALAVKANGTVIIDNCVNDATVKNTGADADAGAFIAFVDKATDTNITLTNSINNATIHAGNRGGGLLGCINSRVVTIDGCVNNGKVTSGDNYSAGIISRFGDFTKGAEDCDTYVLTIKNCINNGDIEAGGSRSGGIISYFMGGSMLIDRCTNTGYIKCVKSGKAWDAAGIFASMSSNYVESNYFIGDLIISNCINTGDIESSGDSGGIATNFGAEGPAEGSNYIIKNCINYGDILDAKDYAAGISAYFWGGTVGNTIDSCINYGKIKNTGSGDGDNTAAIVAYVNSGTFNVTNCVNFSTEMSAAKGRLCTIAINKSAKTNGTYANNYTVAVDGASYNVLIDGWNSDTANWKEAEGSTTIIDATATAADVLARLEAGKVNYILYPGDETLEEAIAPDADFIVGEDGRIALAPIEIDEPDEPGDIPGADAPDTGDSAWIYLAVAVLSVGGVFVVLKKREN